MCIKSIATYALNYKINVLSIPPLKEWAFHTLHCKMGLELLQTILENETDIENSNYSFYQLFMDKYCHEDFGFNQFKPHIVEKIFNNRTQEQIINTQNSLKKFDDEIIIYRGEGTKSTDYSNAYSWTTDINIALFFAIRLETKQARIIQGKISKEKVVDYITDRNEDEIIVRPNDVTDIEILELFSLDEVQKFMEENNLLFEYQSLREEVLNNKTIKRFAKEVKTDIARLILNSLLVYKMKFNDLTDYYTYIIPTIVDTKTSIPFIKNCENNELKYILDDALLLNNYELRSKKINLNQLHYEHSKRLILFSYLATKFIKI